MRDYKNALNSLKASPARRKALPMRTGRASAPQAPTGSSFFNNYQFKFYAAIGVILLSVYFYVRYQIQNHPDSVFHELYMIVKGQVAENPPGGEKAGDKANEKPSSAKSEADGVKKRIDGTRSEKTKDTVAASTKSEDEDLKPITTTEVNLFLGSLDKRSGLVKLTPVKTLVEAGDLDPYASAVKELLRFHSDRDSALVNTFPENVRLRSARIENGVLLLDFNQAFEFNRFGHLGLQVQIQQILWTVFDVSDQRDKKLESISILVDGKRKKTLGGEGMVLKPFYGRSDLVRTIGAKERNNV